MLLVRRTVAQTILSVKSFNIQASGWEYGRQIREKGMVTQDRVLLQQQVFKSAGNLSGSAVNSNSAFRQVSQNCSECIVPTHLRKHRITNGVS